MDTQEAINVFNKRRTTTGSYNHNRPGGILQVVPQCSQINQGRTCQPGKLKNMHYMNLTFILRLLAY